MTATKGIRITRPEGCQCAACTPAPFAVPATASATGRGPLFAETTPARSTDVGGQGTGPTPEAKTQGTAEGAGAS